ncbi:AbiH family protein [Terribacillus aidingensis]|uniref:AbiH family protein n=1 Tax=Terribacillus aidingensis TaxID=586416 RepID=UPI000BE4779C|nr:AbiH family protein [Terribacillus aidingensis]
MRSLFIIGNGFDLDHKLPTSYEQYLLKEYPSAVGMFPSAIQNMTNRTDKTL